MAQSRSSQKQENIFLTAIENVSFLVPMAPYLLHHAKKSEFSELKLFSMIEHVRKGKVTKVAGYDGQYDHLSL